MDMLTLVINPIQPVVKFNPYHIEIAPHVKACLFEGVKTLQSLADCLNIKGKHTSGGGLWSPTTVSRLMVSLGSVSKQRVCLSGGGRVIS